MAQLAFLISLVALGNFHPRLPGSRRHEGPHEEGRVAPRRSPARDGRRPLQAREGPSLGRSGEAEAMNRARTALPSSGDPVLGVRIDSMARARRALRALEAVDGESDPPDADPRTEPRSAESRVVLRRHHLSHLPAPRGQRQHPRYPLRAGSSPGTATGCAAAAASRSTSPSAIGSSPTPISSGAPWAPAAGPGCRAAGSRRRRHRTPTSRPAAASAPRYAETGASSWTQARPMRAPDRDDRRRPAGLRPQAVLLLRLPHHDRRTAPCGSTSCVSRRRAAAAGRPRAARWASSTSARPSCATCSGTRGSRSSALAVKE